MGLLFSKCGNNRARVEQYPIQPKHHGHKSIVSYDFDSYKGQIRAIKEYDKVVTNKIKVKKKNLKER
jgi:hypothetical protein